MEIEKEIHLKAFECNSAVNALGGRKEVLIQHISYAIIFDPKMAYKFSIEEYSMAAPIPKKI